MFAVADDHFFDFLERSGVNESAPSGYGIAAEGAVFVEFEAVAVFKKQDFAADAAELMGKGGVAEEMAVFAMNGNEVAWLD